MMRFLFSIIAVLFLGACAMQNHSFVNSDAMELRPETVVRDFKANAVSTSALAMMAADINNRATSPVSIEVIYPQGKNAKQALMIAERQGNQVKGFLRQNGVGRSVIVQTSPTGQSSPNNIIVSYEALQAAANKNCKTIAHADADLFSHAKDSGYRYGCSMDAMVAAQIVRSNDLLGNDITSPADSQRLGKASDTYRAGDPLTPASETGISASNIYQGQ